MQMRIKDVSVLDAYHRKPQYQGDYTEDGDRPILNPDHAWFILVTVQDGTRWFLRDDAPFFTYHSSDMARDLERGYREFDHETGKNSDEWSPLFQAGPSHVMKLEGLIAKARMEERAEALRRTQTTDQAGEIVDLVTTDSAWGRWPYSEYGSAASDAEMRALEMSERQDPRNW